MILKEILYELQEIRKELQLIRNEKEFKDFVPEDSDRVYQSHAEKSLMEFKA